MRRLMIMVCAAMGVAGVARAGPVAATLCSNGPAAQSFGLAKIVGAPKVYLKNCPPGAADCTELPKTPYVIPGDEVIVGGRAGNAVCVAKPNRLGDTAGWATEYQVAAGDRRRPRRSRPGSGIGCSRAATPST